MVSALWKLSELPQQEKKEILLKIEKTVFIKFDIGVNAKIIHPMLKLRNYL